MTSTRIAPASLKTRIAAVVLLLFLAAIWLLTYLTTRHLQEDLVELLQNQQLSYVSHVADEVEQKVRIRHSLLEKVAKRITPEMVRDPDRLGELLASLPLLLEFFEPGIVVISPEGIGLADYPKVAQRVGSSYREIEYFQEVIATARPALGKPRIGRFTHKPGVAFAVPVRDAQGTTIAVLAGFAWLGDANLFGGIQNAHLGKTGWVAVSDARHRLIVAISDPTRVMQPFPPRGVNVMLDRFAEGYEGSGVAVNSQGREVLTSARMVGSTGWFVQAVLPTTEAFEPIHDLRRRAYSIAAALSVVATAALWFVLRRLLAPLASASREIHGMALGEQEFRELPVGRRDEIGELVASFNILFHRRHDLELALEHQALTDALTGLPNRRHFLEAATKELARTVRYGGPLSVLMIDLDHFKKVNDTHGHQVGDRVLQKFAEIATSAVREADLVARFGGEEFAVLLPGTGLPETLDLAERLRLLLARTEVPLADGVPLRFTVSIGVAGLDRRDTNVDTLLSQADQALYAAKDAGRNCVRVWGETNAAG